MDALTSILAIILCIGSTQGIIFGTILWKGALGYDAKKIQAILLFILSYGLFIQVLRLFGIGYYDTMYHLTIDLNWSYGPLFFLFIKAQATRNFQFSKADRIFLIPILVQATFSIFVRQQNFFWDGTKDSLTWLGYWGYAYWMNYPTAPIVASLLIIFFCIKARKLLKKLDPANVNRGKYKWLNMLIYCFGLYYLLVLLVLTVDLTVHIFTVGDFYFYFTKFFYYPFFIGEAILLYWFGITGIIKKDEPLLKPRKDLSGEEKESFGKIADEITRCMKEDLLFKNPELTVSNLASTLDVKPYLVTKTLNDFLNTSFTDFVNGYRVDAFEKLVKDPSNDKFTILSLAHEAGFNSKSSLNRAVQKHLGISPSELKNS